MNLTTAKEVLEERLEHMNNAIIEVESWRNIPEMNYKDNKDFFIKQRDALSFYLSLSEKLTVKEILLSMHPIVLKYKGDTTKPEFWEDLSQAILTEIGGTR